MIKCKCGGLVTHFLFYDGNNKKDVYFCINCKRRISFPHTYDDYLFVIDFDSNEYPMIDITQIKEVY